MIINKSCETTIELRPCSSPSALPAHPHANPHLSTFGQVNGHFLVLYRRSILSSIVCELDVLCSKELGVAKIRLLD